MEDKPTKIGKRTFQSLMRRNVKLAKRVVGGNELLRLDQLRDLTLNFGFSLAMGELSHFNGAWYVTHAGLLRLAARRRCAGIQTDQVEQFSDPLAGRWVFKATVFKSSSAKGFVGYGDADPSNVSSLVHGAEMRIAETRAVNRALRKAYGIGCVRLKSWARFRMSLSLTQLFHHQMDPHRTPPTVQASASRGSAISSAF